MKQKNDKEYLLIPTGYTCGECHTAKLYQGLKHFCPFKEGKYFLDGEWHVVKSYSLAIPSLSKIWHSLVLAMGVFFEHIK